MSNNKKTMILKPFMPVHCILYGGMDGYIKEIKGEQKPDTIKTLLDGVGVMGGNAYVTVRFSDGHESKVPESIIRGVQWDVKDIVLSDEEIKEIDNQYFQAIEERKEQARLKEIKDKEETEMYLKKYSSYLILKKDHVKGEFDCAKNNIRIELKKEFPNTKFSVSSRQGSSAVNVCWEDGPTVEQVQKITSKYEDHCTDHTGDFRDYNPSNFNKLFGGADYVFEERSMSENTKNVLLAWEEEMKEKGITFNNGSFNGLARQLFTHYAITKGSNIIVKKKDNVKSGLNSPEVWYEIVNEKIEPDIKKDNVDQNVTNNDEELIYIDYSEKAFAITGDTYQHKEILKDLDGSFNKYLKNCGAGWVFPKSKKETVINALKGKNIKIKYL